jgi:hypothetical protein
MSLAVVAYEEKDDMKKETRDTTDKENMVHRKKLINELNELNNSNQGDSHTNLLASNSPKKSTFWEGDGFKMSFTTISPKNQYKKLAILAKGKALA